MRKFKLEINDLKWICMAQNSTRGGNHVNTAVKLLVA